MQKTHILKIDPLQLQAIVHGLKRHEVRDFSDRDFQPGDTLQLRAFNRDTKEYTGVEMLVVVTNITRPSTYGLSETVGVMSIIPHAELTERLEREVETIARKLAGNVFAIDESHL